MTVEVILGILAGLMHIVAFVIYHKQIFQGTSRPDITTWTLWFFLSPLNCVSYMEMNKNWMTWILPISSTIACIVVFVISLFRGKLSELDLWHTIALIIGIVSIGVWWYYRSATYANLLLQVCIIISFIPTLGGVWKDPAKEKSLPWFIWSSAYIFLMAAIFLEWEDKPLQLVYPINCLIWHAWVGILSLRKPKLKT